MAAGMLRAAGLHQGGHEAAAPGQRRMPLDGAPHRQPAILALTQRHGQRGVQRLGNLVRVVRIDQQGGGKLARGAGKARQHEHARVLRVLCGHIFLGHQVHAIAQRRHQAHPRLAHVAGHGRAGDGAGDHAQRRPVRLAPFGVHIPGGAFQCRAQVAIGGDILARGGGNLQQGHVVAPLGAGFQQAAIAGHALHQPLGRVEPIDADHQLLLAQAVAQPVGGRVAPGLRGQGGEFARLDFHRKGAEPDAVAGMADRAIGVAQRAQLALRGGGEILGIVRGLEADQVGGQQVAQQGARFRHGGEHVRRGERHMQEEADRRAHPGAAQDRRQRHQVIIMHPDHVGGAQLRQQGRADALIHRAVHLGAAAVEAHQVGQ